MRAKTGGTAGHLPGRRRGAGRTRGRAWATAVCAGGAALLLAASGCAGGAAGDGAGGEVTGMAQLTDGMINVAADPGDPREGGVVTFGAFAEPTSLDPARTIAAVTTGGIEMVNIYDSLMRHDAQAKSDVPQMAEALTHDDTFTTWTLTLRDGVRFSDGTPVDAAAVKASQERFGAADGPDAAVWNANVTGIATPDDKTVVYTLARPWPLFSNTLTTGAGMIVAPAAGPPGDGFTPIGAGPFTFGGWAQGTSMTLNANEDYWGGAPHLDSVKAVYLPSTEVGRQTFLNGELDTVVLREPDDIAPVLSAGYPGYVAMTAIANTEIINAAPGHAGADPRVRKAIRLAVDPVSVAQRTYGSDELAGSTLFASYSRWNTDAPAAEHDPDKARALVEQAKADGFDGRLVIDSGPMQSKQRQALAVEAQLEAVGFDVEPRIEQTSPDHIRVVANGDYDLGEWGINLREPDPYVKMMAAMHSGGKQVYGMYTSERMDGLIEAFQTAPDDDAKRAVMADIEHQVDEDSPFLVLGYSPEYVAMQRTVHGAVGSSGTMLLLGGAWKE